MASSNHSNIKNSKVTRALLLLTLSFLCIPVFCQNFEGKIVYKVTYKNKDGIVDSITTSQLGAIEQEYFKDGDFKVINNGSKLQWALYINSENKYYYKYSDSDTILWTDAKLYNDSIINMQVLKHAATILRYSCNEIIMTCKKSITKYYYSPFNFLTDPKLFINYKTGNQFDLLNISKAWPLMQVEQDDTGIFESIAIQTVQMKLDKAFFKLPPNSKTKESPH